MSLEINYIKELYMKFIKKLMQLSINLRIAYSHSTGLVILCTNFNEGLVLKPGETKQLASLIGAYGIQVEENFYLKNNSDLIIQICNIRLNDNILCSEIWEI